VLTEFLLGKASSGKDLQRVARIISLDSRGICARVAMVQSLSDSH
jgi:hypothetical protein